MRSDQTVCVLRMMHLAADLLRRHSRDLTGDKGSHPCQLLKPCVCLAAGKSILDEEADLPLAAKHGNAR